MFPKDLLKRRVVVRALFFGALVLVAVIMLVYANNQDGAIAVLAGDVVYEPSLPEETAPIAENAEEPAPEPEPIPIYVYVSGEVSNPGVFRFYGGRIIDAIEAAGGFTEYAAPSAINLAAHLFDTQHIFVSHIDANAPIAESLPDIGGQAASGLININTATAAELQRLHGIGPALSARIVSHREQIGRFSSIEQIMNVSGIGSAIFGNIQSYIIVD